MTFDSRHDEPDLATCNDDRCQRCQCDGCSGQCVEEEQDDECLAGSWDVENDIDDALAGNVDDRDWAVWS